MERLLLRLFAGGAASGAMIAKPGTLVAAPAEKPAASPPMMYNPRELQDSLDFELAFAISGTAALTEGTPQNEALLWLVNEDPNRTTADPDLVGPDVTLLSEVRYSHRYAYVATVFSLVRGVDVEVPATPTVRPLRPTPKPTQRPTGKPWQRPTKRPTREPTFLDPSCMDVVRDCGFWASDGQCEENPIYMADNCARACKFCEPSELPLIEPDIDPAEVPNSAGVVVVASATTAPLRPTPKPTQRPTGKPSEQPTPAPSTFLDPLCMDVVRDCGFWASDGQCEENPIYMADNCARACKFCEPIETTPAPSTFVDSSCIDEVRDCGFWASDGQCEENPVYMADNCARACKFCEPMGKRFLRGLRDEDGSEFISTSSSNFASTLGVGLRRRSLELEEALLSTLLPTGKDICGFDNRPYVRCNSEQEVTRIILREMGLTGTIPHEVGTFNNTFTVLDLADNNLAGTIPKSLYSCTQMTGLYLKSNRLSGTIASKISDLRSLTQLYLGQNRLTGKIPTGIQKLKSIRKCSASCINLFHG